MQGWKRGLFIFSGVVPLLGLFGHPPDTGLLIYSVYVLAYLLREPLTRLADRIPAPPAVALVGLFLLSGCLTETLAWSSNYLKAAAKPALFHPQLFADLIVGLGFYGAWAAAWLIALRRYRFTLEESFLITGFQGIFFEQLGAVFVLMVRTLPVNPFFSALMGAYVLAVHGSAVGLAMIPVIHRFDAPENSRHWSRFLVVMVLMVGLAFVGTQVAAWLTLPFGGLPPPRSIREHPFW